MGSAGLFLIDAHVHVQGCFAEGPFFERALANLEIAADRSGIGPGWLGCLLLTEAAGEQAFGRLKARAASDGSAREWRLTREDCSLVLWRNGEERLVVVGGRQIVSAEQIEVLALGTIVALPDGQPLTETLAAVRAVGALPVLPWGFGKWLGRRGRMIAERVASARPGELFLGDNGGRLAGSARPRLFARAEARGLAVLPGSDPLPFAQEAAKVGRYGFVLRAPFEPAAPFAAIRAALTRLAGSPRPFGRLERLPTFAHRQIAMQFAKRRRAAT